MTTVLVFVCGKQSMTSIIDVNRYQSRPIDINQDQSISINRLILIINDQSLAKIRAVIDWYRCPITIDWYRLVEDFVTFQNLQAEGIGIKISQLCTH